MHTRFGARWLWTMCAGLAAIAIVLVVAARHDSSAVSSETRARGAVRQIEGLPQTGLTLGVPFAPATLTIYADVSNVGYASFDEGVLPTLIRRYVAPGRLKLTLRVLASDPGPPVPSDAGRHTAELALAASLQSRLWQFVRAAVAMSAGYVDETVTTAAARLVPGLDRARLTRTRGSRRVASARSRAHRLASDAGVRSTPAFFVTTGERTRRLTAPLAVGPFVRALNRSLRGAA